jgi:hypothetical protein
MNWQQMTQAILALEGSFHFSISPREDGSWYVSNTNASIRTGGCLRGVSGNGEHPLSAIEAHWTQLTELKPGEYIVLSAIGGRQRRAVKWNGFMWADVNEEIELARQERQEASK